MSVICSETRDESKVDSLTTALASRLGSLIRDLLISITVAIVWIFVVSINNNFLFWWAAIENWAHLVYFPAGLKLIIVMLFGLNGVVGIFVGSIYNFADAFPFLTGGSRVILAGLYAFAPLIICSVFESFTGKHYPWVTLNFVDIVILSVGTSVLSSVFLSLGLLILSNQDFSAVHVFTLVVGDLFGILFFFFIIAIIRWASRNLVR